MEPTAMTSCLMATHMASQFSCSPNCVAWHRVTRGAPEVRHIMPYSRAHCPTLLRGIAWHGMAWRGMASSDTHPHTKF
eukprot:1151771-Pelagomonas_calceolata.AAC.2